MAKPRTQLDDTSLAADAQSALPALVSAGEAALDLIDGWLERGNAAAVQAAALHGAGPAKKAARRALNVLKSRGISIPVVNRKATLTRAEPKLTKAWMLSPDAAGIRLIAFSKAGAGGSCQACMIFLRDGQGVLQIETSLTTPSRLRTALAKALPGAGYDAVEVPVDWARTKVARARALHAERGIPEPLGFTSAAGLLEPVPESAPEHPFDAEGFEFADEDAAELAADSGSLHHMPEFRAWMPSQNAMRQLLSAVGNHLDPDKPAEPAVVSELLKTEMLAATDRYFTPDLRADLVEWMKDAGISLHAREGESTALKLAATIQVVQKCGLVTDPPQDVPFLRAFFEKAISVMMAQSGGKLDIPVPRRS
jgi:hypothetical protein